MNHLQQAIAVTDQIADALRAELERARAERVLIRAMDVEGLVRRASLRAEFNAAVSQRQARLSLELAAAGQAFGLTEVSVDGLRAFEPELADRLADSLAQVRALAAALAELDDLNRMLGQRALSYVRAYLGALNPTPAAYDRRGSAAAAAAARTTSTLSRVV
jgi:hypothetical protein